MLISIDYDGVLASDPELWNRLITLSLRRGHKTIVNSGRNEISPPSKLPPETAFISTSGRAKSRHLENRGIHPDIWIDARPFSIHNDFDACLIPDTPKPAQIAIDYDGTWTTDRELWSSFTRYAISRGNQVLIATGREKQDRIDPPVTPSIPIRYTSGMAKSDFLKNLGIHPDIWIDDKPALICRDFGLVF